MVQRGRGLAGTAVPGSEPGRGTGEPPEKKVANRPDVKRMTVLLDPEDHKRLGHYAVSTGEKKYKLLERAVKEFLDRNEA